MTHTETDLEPSGEDDALNLTSNGVVVTETSADPKLTDTIREHAQEVSGFVREGMTAMMQNMMG